MGNSYTTGNREAIAPGHSPPALAQPSVAPATPGATASVLTGAVEGGGSTRGRRGRPRGSERGSRATRAARFPQPLQREESAVDIVDFAGKESVEREERANAQRGRIVTSRFLCRQPERHDLRGF